MSMRTRLLSGVQVAALLCVAVVSMATSEVAPPACTTGGAPFPNQSQVPLDSVLTVVGPDIEDDTPQIGGTAISLIRLMGQGSPKVVGISVRRSPIPSSAPTNGGMAELVTWEVVPDEPLQPNTRYFLRGIDYAMLETAHYQAADPAWKDANHDWSSSREFTTQSEPWLFHAVVQPVDDKPGRRITLVFTEAMDVNSLGGGQITVKKGAGANATTSMKLLTDPVAQLGHAHLIDIRVEDLTMIAEPGGPSWKIEVGKNAKGKSGVLLQGQGAQTGQHAPDLGHLTFRESNQVIGDPLSVFRGEASCDSRF